VPHSVVFAPQIETFLSTDQNRTKTKGVFLVVHGLNLKPERMKEWISWLCKNGYDCVLLYLEGHELRPKNQTNLGLKVTREIWLKNFQAGLKKAQTQAAMNDCPVFFFGYSLGALLCLDYVEHFCETLPFEKQIFLAPAFGFGLLPRLGIPLLKLLRYEPRLKIPSLSMKHYQAQSETPIAAYKAIHESYLSVVQKGKIGLKNSNCPTLVMCHPRDELVSIKEIQKLIQSQKLTHWTLKAIPRLRPKRLLKYHHLVIDSDSVGDHTWNWMEHQIQAFL
jgi:esterase/lipase